MVDESVKVNVGTSNNTKNIALDTVGDVAYPIYKQGFSEDGEQPVHVSEDNPLPTHVSNVEIQNHSFSRQDDLLSAILMEMKILNKYMAMAHDEEITEDDIEDIE